MSKPSRYPRTHARPTLSTCRVALLLLAAVVVQPASATLWKWTDGNGRVVYSDIQPSGDVKAERVNGPPPPANPNAAKQLASQEAELKKRQMERADDATKADKAKADAVRRQQACTQARANVKGLQMENVQHFRINERGEKIIMDANMRRQERERLEAFVHDNCPAEH